MKYEKVIIKEDGSNLPIDGDYDCLLKNGEFQVCTLEEKSDFVALRKQWWVNNVKMFYLPLPEQESKSAEEILEPYRHGRNVAYIEYKDAVMIVSQLINAQSHPEAREMPSDEEIEKKKRALKLQKEQLGYGIKEVMHFMDGFNIAIKWLREQLNLK